MLKDIHYRELKVLRLSLTNKCNFSCPYCLPENHSCLTTLTNKQFLSIIKVACKLGVNSLRLTGGEPLISSQLYNLMESINRFKKAQNHPLNNLQDIAITTNGSLLTKDKCQDLFDYGLDRITVSLDALDPKIFSIMTGDNNMITAKNKLNNVLQGIDNAIKTGFDPLKGKLKINCVIKKNINDNQIINLVRFAKAKSIEIRFIEYMDVGTTNNWQANEVVKSHELISIIKKHFKIKESGRLKGNTAYKWYMNDSNSYISTISSISNPFCSDCNRLRITSDGFAHTCLFSNNGSDLKKWLNPSIDEKGLEEFLEAIWLIRDDKYSENRFNKSDNSKPQKSHPSMSYLGG
ncbi:GTP 3',8-cyclase MoaA [Prochlorococcus marinus]|uniref:GTP 3',8-cyclase MoaA n=1 Tax=Prochlorococcus marinus TaxID=1219 RepID=UPI0039AFAC7E